MTRLNRGISTLGLIFFLGCQSHVSGVPRAPVSATPRNPIGIAVLGGVGHSEQLVVVTTPSWTSTSGTMERFERATPTSDWTKASEALPVVVGRTGIAWGVGFDDASTEGPHKHEGDGKAPAGIFPIDTAFGFDPREATRSLRLPYVQ